MEEGRMGSFFSQADAPVCPAGVNNPSSCHRVFSQADAPDCSVGANNPSHCHRFFSQADTPAYIFDLDQFEERARLVREHFGPDTGLCFSVKANPFLLADLPEVFDKVEVCSPGELRICEKTGIDPKKIIFSGVNKTAADVERALDDGVGVFTVESYLQAERISAGAVRRGVRVPALVRVTGGSQFGMDEEDVTDLIRRRADYPGIEFVGIHYFTGTQKRKPSAVEKELDHISSFAGRLREETRCSLRRIEYGAGLAADYFKDNADELELERLEAASAKVREVAGRYELTVEMGRFFAAPCGYYLTRVMDVKTNCGISYGILDGGLHQLKYDGQIQGMQIPRILHLKAGQNAGVQALQNPGTQALQNPGAQALQNPGAQALQNPGTQALQNPGAQTVHSPGAQAVQDQETQAGQNPVAIAGGPGGIRREPVLTKWTLCGSLCTTADVLAREVELESLEIGDLLVFCRTGAYSATEGMAAFLSRDMPQIFLYSEKEGLRMQRERLYTDLFHTPRR